MAYSPDGLRLVRETASSCLAFACSWPGGGAGIFYKAALWLTHKACFQSWYRRRSVHSASTGLKLNSGADRTRKSTKDSGLDNSCSLLQDLYSEVLHAFAASETAERRHTLRPPKQACNHVTKISSAPQSFSWFVFLVQFNLNHFLIQMEELATFGYSSRI